MIRVFEVHICKLLKPGVVSQGIGDFGGRGDLFGFDTGDDHVIELVGVGLTGSDRQVIMRVNKGLLTTFAKTYHGLTPSNSLCKTSPKGLNNGRGKEYVVNVDNIFIDKGDGLPTKEMDGIIIGREAFYFFFIFACTKNKQTTLIEVVVTSLFELCGEALPDLDDFKNSLTVIQTPKI